MSQPQAKKPHILFLFSDTGGGHRSAAEAIIEALELEFPAAFTTEMVDIFKEYAPPPLDLAPAMYPPMASIPDIWGLWYRLSNGRRRTHFVSTIVWPYVREHARLLIREHPSDIIISVHPLANAPVLRALGEDRPPFISVVTDLVTTHAFWYHRSADLVLVPTEPARQRGLQVGLRPEQIEVIGLPVADRFCQPVGAEQELRKNLGWPLDLPVVLMMGGGEGMGPVERVAYAIDSSGLKLALMIVAGRNQKLKRRLEKHNWNIPTRVYGFVREVPQFMRAADILVTKAGPGTICESFIANLPMILYSRMPGQEDGNVTYVVEQGAGVWAPQPDQVVEAVATWLRYPQLRVHSAAACQKLAKPGAAREIARKIAHSLEIDLAHLV